MADESLDYDTDEYWDLVIRFRRSQRDVGMFMDGTGVVLRCHPRYACNMPCAIHGPSDHHMRYWPTYWRQDLLSFERLCEHGIGHPDPDSLRYIQDHQGVSMMRAVSTHGCDGCCAPPEEP